MGTKRGLGGPVPRFAEHRTEHCDIGAAAPAGVTGSTPISQAQVRRPLSSVARGGPAAMDPAPEPPSTESTMCRVGLTIPDDRRSAGDVHLRSRQRHASGHLQHGGIPKVDVAGPNEIQCAAVPSGARPLWPVRERAGDVNEWDRFATASAAPSRLAATSVPSRCRRRGSQAPLVRPCQSCRRCGRPWRYRALP